jgi:hypothetical protein
VEDKDSATKRAANNSESKKWCEEVSTSDGSLKTHSSARISIAFHGSCHVRAWIGVMTHLDMDVAVFVITAKVVHSGRQFYTRKAMQRSFGSTGFPIICESSAGT